MNVLKRLIHRGDSHQRSSSEDPALNLGSREFEVNNWAISEFIINKLVTVSGIHPYPLAELNLMVAALCRLKPQQIFEWGTNIGKSARIFHDTGKEFRIPLHIHSIDLPDDVEHNEHPRSDRGYLVRGLSGVTLYQADGLTKAVELYQSTSDLRTLVFIDGDHSYESVFRELKGVIRNMPNANILLHDTFFQSEESGYNTGPFRAISDVLKSDSSNLKVMTTTTGLPGMTLLYRL